MKPLVATATAAALLLSVPAIATADEATSDSATTTISAPSGDAAAGEGVFSKQCVACHLVTSPDGEVLAGTRGHSGPDLYGVAGRPIASHEGFRYGKSIAEVGETGAVWTEDEFVAYVQDPTHWLRETLDSKKARSKMGWKVRDPKDAADLYAYLYSLAPHEAQ